MRQYSSMFFLKKKHLPGVAGSADVGSPALVDSRVSVPPENGVLPETGV